MKHRAVDDSCRTLPALDATIIGLDGVVIRHSDGRLPDPVQAHEDLELLCHMVEGQMVEGRMVDAERRAQLIGDVPVQPAWEDSPLYQLGSVLKWMAIIGLACVGFVGLLVGHLMLKDLFSTITEG